MEDPVVVEPEAFEASWDATNRWLRLRMHRSGPMTRDAWGRTFERIGRVVPVGDEPFRILADCRGLGIEVSEVPGAIAAAYIRARRHRLPRPTIAIVTEARLLEHAAQVYFQLTGYSGACFMRRDAAEAWLRAR